MENTQHFSVSRLTSYEISLLSLTSPHNCCQTLTLTPCFLYLLIGCPMIISLTLDYYLVLDEICHETPSPKLTSFYFDGSYFWKEDGAFHDRYVITDQYKLLPNVKSAYMAEYLG